MVKHDVVFAKEILAKKVRGVAEDDVSTNTKISIETAAGVKVISAETQSGGFGVLRLLNTSGNSSIQLSGGSNFNYCNNPFSFGSTSQPDTSAYVEIESTSKGFLPPRMTTAQRDAISSPATGLVIYNTTTNVLNFYNGSAWGAV